MQQIFNQYVNYLEAERNASPYTIRNYTTDLLDFFSFLRSQKIGSLHEVDKQVIRDYLSYLLEQGFVKVSIARKLSAIRSFYRYLMREEIVRALLEILYASGLRVSELVNLDIDKVNLDANEIRVWGKGSRERVVLMGKPAAAALVTYISQGRTKLLGGKRNPALFVNRSGRRLVERRVQRILEKYSAAAGINRRVHPHMLRHTFATHLLDGGADLRVVQQLLGHADLSTTQIYTHVTKSQARKVYLSAHPMAGGKQDNGSEGQT